MITEHDILNTYAECRYIQAFNTVIQEELDLIRKYQEQLGLLEYLSMPLAR